MVICSSLQRHFLTGRGEKVCTGWSPRVREGRTLPFRQQGQETDGGRAEVTGVLLLGRATLQRIRKIFCLAEIFFVNMFDVFAVINY